MIEYIIFKLAGLNSEKSVEIRRKDESYNHVVKSTWNQALSRSIKQGCGGKAILEHAWANRRRTPA